MPESTVSIEVVGTPNPNAAKFVLDRPVPGEGSRSYFDADSIQDDPLASGLFAVEGVRALLLVENFITVTKQPDADWDAMVPEVERAIRDALGD